MSDVYAFDNFKLIAMLGLGGTRATMLNQAIQRLGQQVVDHAACLSSIMGATASP